MQFERNILIQQETMNKTFLFNVSNETEDIKNADSSIFSISLKTWFFFIIYKSAYFYFPLFMFHSLQFYLFNHIAVKYQKLYLCVFFVFLWNIILNFSKIISVHIPQIWNYIFPPLWIGIFILYYQSKKLWHNSWLKQCPEAYKYV